MRQETLFQADDEHRVEFEPLRLVEGDECDGILPPVVHAVDIRDEGDVLQELGEPSARVVPAVACGLVTELLGSAP